MVWLEGEPISAGIGCLTSSASSASSASNTSSGQLWMRLHEVAD